MTLRAVWDILPSDGTVTGACVIVRTPADVTQLVSRLSESGADTAKIVDASTPTDAWPDHMIHAVVADGVGYLSHWDADHDPAYTKGDPASRAVETRDESFPPGSGVSLEKFTAALTGSSPPANAPSASSGGPRSGPCTRSATNINRDMARAAGDGDCASPNSPSRSN